MLQIYNSLTKRIEPFTPLNPGKVGMYTCGPTVYSDIHLGNIRAYLMADTVRRYLEYQGYEVRMIKNITDVGHLTADDIAQGDSGEDKILKKALAEKKTPEEIARFFEERFHEVEQAMNIRPAHYFPRATAHVAQMIKIIETLIAKGHAYEKNGNVFFDVTSFSDYGKLSGNTFEHLKVGARLEEHPDKRNPWDFALWLKAPENHILKWASPWSIGYPGWHIECTAMSTEYLGSTIDIHTGGEDNIFPHHEAEIAQSECSSGEKFVNYWIHLRHLLKDGEKMSKSKGTLYTLNDITEKGFSPMDLRLALLSAHHRTQFNFTWQSLEEARRNIQKINGFVLELEGLATTNHLTETPFDTDTYLARFETAMDDDFNTPLALSVVYDLISKTNAALTKREISAGDAHAILSIWKKMNKTLGIKLSGQAEVPQEILQLAKEREEARKGKDFTKSDELRALILQKGYHIEDTKEGQKIRPLN